MSIGQARSLPQGGRRISHAFTHTSGIQVLVASTTYIGLLRGINVGSSPRVPMGSLRALCENLGWQDVRTYIQSGNIVFRSTSGRRILEDELEQALTRAFSITPAVIVRKGREWTDLAAQNPFVEEARLSPNLVMLASSKRPPVPTTLESLQARAGSERIVRVGDAIWIFFADGAGRSKLTPGVLDRATGSPVTMRNLNTVLKLAELASE